jgi:hypothetical protein
VDFLENNVIIFETVQQMKLISASRIWCILEMDSNIVVVKNKKYMLIPAKEQLRPRLKI